MNPAPWQSEKHASKSYLNVQGTLQWSYDIFSFAAHTQIHIKINCNNWYKNIFSPLSNYPYIYSCIIFNRKIYNNSIILSKFSKVRVCIFKQKSKTWPLQILYVYLLLSKWSILILKFNFNKLKHTGNQSIVVGQRNYKHYYEKKNHQIFCNIHSVCFSY